MENYRHEPLAPSLVEAQGIRDRLQAAVNFGEHKFSIGIHVNVSEEDGRKIVQHQALVRLRPDETTLFFELLGVSEFNEPFIVRLDCPPVNAYETDHSAEDISPIP